MKRITLYDFVNLPDQEQYEIITCAGDYLDIRMEENKIFVLYSIGLFFVEVEYVEHNKMIKKRAFVQGEILDKYSSLNYI